MKSKRKPFVFEVPTRSATHQLGMRVPEGLLAQYQAIAHDMKTTVQQLVLQVMERALQDYIKDQGLDGDELRRRGLEFLVQRSASPRRQGEPLDLEEP